jgi:WD40 repeat protein
MKSPSFHTLLLAGLLAANGGLAWSATDEPPGDLAAELSKMRAELARQTERVDRLYRAFGPHLEEMEASAAEQEKQAKKQEQEDKTLGLERVWESKGGEFTDRAECSPTEGSLAVVAKDGGIRILDLDGKPLRTLRHPEESVRAISYSPDGTRLLAGTKGGKVLVWDLKSALLREVATRPYDIERVAWLGTTGRVLACSVSGEKIDGPAPGEFRNVRGDVLELDSGKPVCEFTGWQHADYQNVMPAPDGKWVAILKIIKQPDGSKGRGAYLLDALTGEIAGKLLPKGGGGLSVAVSPDSKTAAVGDPGIFLWDVAACKLVRHLEGHENWVVALAFSNDGRHLISGAGDSTARVWDLQAGTETGRIRFPGGSTYVYSVDFSFDGERVIAVTEDGQLVIARTRPGG